MTIIRTWDNNNNVLITWFYSWLLLTKIFINLVGRRRRVTWEVRGGQRVNISSCSDPNTLQEKSIFDLLKVSGNFTFDPIRSVGGLLGGDVLIEAVEALWQGTVHIEPPVTDKVLLVEQGAVGAEEAVPGQIAGTAWYSNLSIFRMTAYFSFPSEESLAQMWKAWQSASGSA